jgi:antitoxin (DNA-binding transcriptional repressor) of toxin-antitoxin stability system
MKQVGIFEAKTHFSALVDDAERGESTLITRKGNPWLESHPSMDPNRASSASTTA